MVRAVAASWSLIGRATSVLWSLRTLIRSMSDHETTVQTQSVRTLQVYTQIPPRSPRAEGGEETLISVAGLGAQNRAQLMNGVGIFLA